MVIYSYSKTARSMTLIVPVVLMAALFIWALYELLSGNMQGIYKLIIYTMPVLLLSSFIGLHNPSSIVVTNESIIFSGFGRSHVYTWQEAGLIKVRRYHYVGKTLIRLGKPRILGGRYWITNEMKGYEELLGYLEKKSAEGE